MAGQQGQPIIDFDGTFFSGSKSDTDPSQLPLAYFWSGINVINQGGVVSTRPGNHCIVTFPDGNLQGASIFRPLVGIEQMLVAVDGLIYVSPYPFRSWVQVPNIQFSPSAKQIYWALTTQSAIRIDNTFTSATKVILPKAVMIMQDGGQSAPAFYDGSQSGHIRGNDFETPAGASMVWVGDRLWVATGNQVFASDISNPISFREDIYLGGVSSFFFTSEVTAMVKTPSIESPQLMVFTETDASILEANIRDRTQWPTTTDFQREVVQVGCHSQRSVLSHYGQVVWFSPSGVALFDPATSGKLTARLPVRDNEMMVSKTTLNEDLSLVAAASFGQWLLMSVPSADQYNRHTWVLNHASLATLNDDSGPAWSGYWIGTRPVEWVSGVIANVERIYHVSTDFDGHNRLWQSFSPDCLDNGCPITWAVETRGYFGLTASIKEKAPGARCRLTFADIALAGITEDLNLGVFYAGGTRGSFKQILDRKLTVEKGSLKYDQILTDTSPIFAFKPQSRVIRTEDANQQADIDVISACAVERLDIDNIDESFQFLVVGHGVGTIRWIRTWALTIPEDKSGDSNACTDETGLKGVRFDGVGVNAPDYATLVAALATAPEALFDSNQTRVVEQGGMTAVGVGQAESIVSQAAADRVAGIIAQKMAENELIMTLPPIISLGEGGL
jgi:hypothetical protein